MIRVIFVMLSLSLVNLANSAQVVVSNSIVEGSLPVNSWKALRDQNLVKQDLDYSCGAASIATILTEHYQRPTTESEVLELLIDKAKQQDRASFADMQKILPNLGFRGIGIATSWEKLTQLKIPVLLYVKQRKQDHFTVISGITHDSVKLSDPSLGNRFLTRGQFKEIWQTRDETGFEGKMLAILPLDEKRHQKVNPDYFTKPNFSKVPTSILLDGFWTSQ